jgi:hypothetical protein
LVGCSGWGLRIQYQKAEAALTTDTAQRGERERERERSVDIAHGRKLSPRVKSERGTEIDGWIAIDSEPSRDRERERERGGERENFRNTTPSPLVHKVRAASLDPRGRRERRGTSDLALDPYRTSGRGRTVPTTATGHRQDVPYLHHDAAADADTGRDSSWMDRRCTSKKHTSLGSSTK